ncbi:MAG: tRNA uridine-5-carboxymethylaminomethyl(34) synthesis GTPase MnmE [Rikenellaceae bacterium]
MSRDRADIIVAPATLTGGAVAMVRLSGDESITLVQSMFRSSKDGALINAKGHTAHYGDIVNANGEVVDDVLVTIFRAPHSYTGEESVEISCHGSQYIVQQIISLAVDQGARMAEAGEFTIRAYLAGRIDLSQAEAVADMIATTSAASHAMASTQMRGGYSAKLTSLRGSILSLVTLLELELDFSEEDVEFADRGRLTELINECRSAISKLAESFKVGNAIKNGVAVAIVGEPNVGKSTLLNRLLNDDRAMVSDIAGTTRDVIEESITIKGLTFRFLDTAGLHDTDDRLEQMGIDRTYQAISRAHVILHLVDARVAEVEPLAVAEDQTVITVRNKVDLSGESHDLRATSPTECTDIYISAKEDIGIDMLLERLYSTVDTASLYAGDPIVSNIRHYDHLRSALDALDATLCALTNGIPTDLVCEDIRTALYHIGSITGEITTDDILGNIFSNFCIGK